MVSSKSGVTFVLLACLGLSTAQPYCKSPGHIYNNYGQYGKISISKLCCPAGWSADSGDGSRCDDPVSGRSCYLCCESGRNGGYCSATDKVPSTSKSEDGDHAGMYGCRPGYFMKEGTCWECEEGEEQLEKRFRGKSCSVITTTTTTTATTTTTTTTTTTILPECSIASGCSSPGKIPAYAIRSFPHCTAAPPAATQNTDPDLSSSLPVSRGTSTAFMLTSTISTSSAVPTTLSSCLQPDPTECLAFIARTNCSLSIKDSNVKAICPALCGACNSTSAAGQQTTMTGVGAGGGTVAGVMLTIVALACAVGGYVWHGRRSKQQQQQARDAVLEYPAYYSSVAAAPGNLAEYAAPNELGGNAVYGGVEAGDLAAAYASPNEGGSAVYARTGSDGSAAAYAPITNASGIYAPSGDVGMGNGAALYTNDAYSNVAGSIA
eukprot:gene1230-15386_t